MTRNRLAQLALQLPLDEQLELAQEIWDHAAPPADFHLSPELKALLDARRQEALADPEAGTPWEQVKARLLADLSGTRSFDRATPL
jgi:putative addiction module component (TIGR02574 family)